MKMVKGFSFFLILAIALSGCFEYKEVEMIAVKDVKLNSFSMKGAEIGVEMQISNPNTYKVSVVDSDLELLIKGEKIGTAKIKNDIILPKNSNQTHQFVIESFFDNIGGAMPSLMGAMMGQPIELQVKGNIKGKAKSFSKKFPVDFKEKIQL